MQKEYATSTSVIAILRSSLIILLVFACFKLTQPFLGALIWAIIIAISSWPAVNWLTRPHGLRRSWAVIFVTVLLLLALVTPIALMVMAFNRALPAMIALIHQLAHYHLPPLPAWLTTVPFIGSHLEHLWHSTQNDLLSMIDKLRPTINETALWSLNHGVQLGLSLIEIVLAIVVAGFLLLNGDAVSHIAKRTVVKLGGAAASDLPNVVARTLRSVMTGIVGTALAQTLLCVVGLIIADVPGFLALGFLCFVLAIAQLPTMIIWLPAAGWVFYKGETGYAIFLVVWGFFLVNTIDNFIKPLLISQGAQLPLSLIFLGVLGGLIAWGVMGLFIGPTLLAVSYSLFQYWLTNDPK